MKKLGIALLAILSYLVVGACVLKLLSFSDVSIIHDDSPVYAKGLLLFAWPITLFVDGFLNTGIYYMGELVEWITS